MLRTIAGFAVALTILAAAPVAQVPSAVITGTVLDPAGLPVAKARVTAKSLDTALEISRETATDGTFRLAGLPPGNYRVEVAQASFAPYRVERVELEVRQAIDLDIHLKLASQTDAVTVAEVVAPVEAASSPMGFNVDQDQLDRLPLVQRDVAGLATLGPGVIPRQLGGFTGDVVTGVEPSRGNVSENPPVNGMRSTMNTYLLDGVLNTDSNVRAIVVNPPIDAIQEFRLQTSASSADFGYSGGGVVNVVTRSGAEQLHGGLFDYFRNEALDARNFFASGSGPKPVFRQNQFGGHAGGKIPHTERLFFFAAYEGLQLNQGQSKASSVPTSTLRAGTFTGTSTVSDPLTGLPFPNDSIPAARMDHIAQTVISEFEPLPNQPGTPNYLSTTPILNGNDSVSGRVDWDTASHGILFARYSINDERSDAGNGRLLEPTHLRVRAQQAAIGDTYAGAGDWVNEFRFGFNRLKIQDISFNAYTNNYVGQLGINGLDEDPVNYGLPAFILTSNLLITSDDPTLPLTQASETFQGLDHWSKRRGRHTVQLGAEVRRFVMAYQDRMNSRGYLTFTGSFSGDPFGDFLLGYPDVTQRTVGQPQAYLRQLGYAFYAQDEFRVTSRLVLTYGLRYDYNSPFTEKYDHMYNLDYSTLPAQPTLVQEGANSSTMPKDLVAPNRLDFAPRAGLAWRPLASRNLVFRAAYGLYYNPEIAQQAYDLVLNGVSTEQDTAPPPAPGANPILTLKNPFATGLSTGFPGYYGIDPHEKSPYAQQWNGAWQYGTRGFLFEAGYIGTKGTHLGRFRKFNTPQHVEIGQDLPPRPGDIQELRTFPDLGPFIQRQNIANSIYHSLQLRAERRWSSGFSMQTSFVWSKSLDDADSIIQGLFDSVGAQNEANLRLERGPSFFNVPRRFTANFAYDLPFGRGHRLVAASPMTALVSGWTVSGTGLMQDGTPENSFYFFSDPANTDTPNRPNIVPGQSISLPAGQRTLAEWFNTAAFSTPAPYTFGDAGRDLLPTPSAKVFSFAVTRSFSLGEKRSLKFRGEFFNAFNHPNLGIPGNNPDFGPAFGAIETVGDPRQVQLSLRLSF
jgi:outer membrane receptor protein involved in Fe transport